MALTRKFGNKRYHFDSQHTDWKGGELHAHSKAIRIRQGGGLARITTEGTELNKVWIVWSRNK